MSDKKSQENTIIEAEAGSAIAFDDTGLVMTLSDRVVRDIALRLKGLDAPSGQALNDALSKALKDIDHWAAHLDGEWITFQARLPGRQGARAYRVHIEGGDVVAQTHEPIWGILGLGGPRGALAIQRECHYPFHVLAPKDEAGAVGHGGTEAPPLTDQLQHLVEVTQDATLAETLLETRMKAFAPLPLFLTRYECDNSASFDALIEGPAVKNLLIAARNLRDAGLRLDQKVKLLCVRLSFALEMAEITAAAYQSGMIRLMDHLTAELMKLGFDQPVFLTEFECGIDGAINHDLIKAQWTLSWDTGDHRLITSCASHDVDRDAYGRLGNLEMERLGKMSACALQSYERDGKWIVPRLHLAEREGSVIRVTCVVDGKLVLDDTVAETHGFSVMSAGKEKKIKSVEIDPDDPKALLVTLTSRTLTGEAILYYACDPKAAGPRKGQLRDDWTPNPLHGDLGRWALPAILEVH
ncbi:MAG: hypothetical protein AAF198_09395 [Pseudomonadota bacterium]